MEILDLAGGANRPAPQAEDSVFAGKSSALPGWKSPHSAAGRQNYTGTRKEGPNYPSRYTVDLTDSWESILLPSFEVMPAIVVMPSLSVQAD